MSIEEKVGQMFMVYFDGETANENAKKLIQESKVGGIVLYNWANNLENPEKVYKLCHGLQTLNPAKVPLLIAVDQEGGLVCRLQKGFSEFPGNASLGKTQDPKLSLKAAEYMGQEMQSVGINFTLSPVVDVNSNPKNPVIGIRAYGDDPKVVAQFAEAALIGYQKAGVISCLKHFPGHGDVSIDSHRALPVVSKSLEELLEVELYPFIKLAKKASAIMTAHILFPQIDPKNPATLSSCILQGILRDKLGFEGVLVTDSLSMKGILQGHTSLEEVVFKAIEAGNDIVLIGGRSLQNQSSKETPLEEMTRIVTSVVQAVEKGKIAESRIDQSVKRILTLKEKIALKKSSFEEVKKDLQKKESLQLAKEIAYRSVSIQKWDYEKEISLKKTLILAPKLLESKIRDSSLSSMGTFFHFFSELSFQKQEALLEKLKEVEQVVFISYNAHREPLQKAFLCKVAEKLPTIHIAARDPSDLDINTQAVITIATHSPTKCAFDVVGEWLQNKTEPICIPDEKMESISHKIWYNECNNRVDQLTFWNKKEPFPSMGIGHFIWPPECYEGPFKEGRFHKFIVFAKDQGVKVPAWLENQRYCLWPTREAFYNAFDSVKMQELRDFLGSSVAIQAKYMVHRLQEAFYKIVLQAPLEKREAIINNFFSVASSKNGLYILVDYLNFKHEGTDVKERYKGKGWGLSQVLQEMDGNSSPEKAFAEAAKFVLSRRVENSPNQVIETAWIPGWFSRVDSYLGSLE